MEELGNRAQRCDRGPEDVVGITSRAMKEEVVGGLKYSQGTRRYHHLSSLDLPVASDAHIQMCARHLKSLVQNKG